MPPSAENTDTVALREARAALIAAEQQLAEVPDLHRRIAGLAAELDREGLKRTRLQARVEQLEHEALILRGERAPLQSVLQRQRRIWRSRAGRVVYKGTLLLKRSRLAHSLFRR